MKRIKRHYAEHYENVLGTSMDLKVICTSRRNFEKGELAVFDEIRRLSRIFSTYDANSEFSRWMRTLQQPLPISNELFEVLDLFDNWRERTNGALDASAAIVIRVWKQAAARGKLPSRAELDGAITEAKQPHWRLDHVSRSATHLSTSPLVLNTFVKSYIIRHAADAGKVASQAAAIIVNIGGDLIVSGNLDETVLVSDPRADAENDLPLDRIRISNKAVATSGGYRRGELIQKDWYSHIVDPRTGEPAKDTLSATVVAPNATDAGALATAFNVIDSSEIVKLTDRLEQIEYLIITSSGKRIESSGWKKMEKIGSPVN